MGGLGADTLDGGAFDDTLLGGGGQDVLRGGGGEDQLRGGQGADRLFGGAHHDLLVGGKGDDFLKGGGGRDTLMGGAGDDTLMPGLNKAEVARGGKGEDVFMFNGQRGDPSTNNFTPQTNIQDFEVGVDRLEISGEITNYFSTQGSVSTRLILENGTNIVLEGILFDDLVLSDLF